MLPGCYIMCVSEPCTTPGIRQVATKCLSVTSDTRHHVSQTKCLSVMSHTKRHVSQTRCLHLPAVYRGKAAVVIDSCRERLFGQRVATDRPDCCYLVQVQPLTQVILSIVRWYSHSLVESVDRLLILLNNHRTLQFHRRTCSSKPSE